MRPVARYALNVLVWLDCGLNWLTGGDPTETLSSRAGKAARAGRPWGCVLCRVLGWIRRNHCENSVDPTAGWRALRPDGPKPPDA